MQRNHFLSGRKLALSRRVERTYFVCRDACWRSFLCLIRGVSCVRRRFSFRTQPPGQTTRPPPYCWQCDRGRGVTPSACRGLCQVALGCLRWRDKQQRSRRGRVDGKCLTFFRTTRIFSFSRFAFLARSRPESTRRRKSTRI